IAGRFERALFVGDPGQLDPFSTVEVERWAGLAWDPMRSAVAVLLAHNPDLPVHRLPVSWRLPASAAPVVSEAFYPFTGFRAGTGPGDRRLEFGTRGMGTTYDRALEEAAATGWSLFELPARHTLRTDAEAVRATAALAVRLLQRGPVAHSEQGSAAVGAARRHRVPSGVGAAVRPDVPPPARVRRRGAGWDSRAARRASVRRAGAPGRAGEVPRRVGGQPGGPGAPVPPPDPGRVRGAGARDGKAKKDLRGAAGRWSSCTRGGAGRIL